ncbi:MAG: M23 family metallopeptidase [Anaerolineae bacterium]|nr:M23 family metallopeptidase [Anaerolineae bacterium]
MRSSWLGRGVLIGLLALILAGYVLYDVNRVVEDQTSAPFASADLADNVDWLQRPATPQSQMQVELTTAPTGYPQSTSGNNILESGQVESSKPQPVSQAQVTANQTVTLAAMDETVKDAPIVVAQPAPVSPVRCLSPDTWSLPLRQRQMKISAQYGSFGNKSAYFKTISDVGGLKENAQAVFHPGLDFKAGLNAPVYAVADAIVERTGYSDQYGLHLILRLPDAPNGDEVWVLYGHLADVFTSAGISVQCGQVLALSGNTGKAIKGAHLHFEVRVNGRSVNPGPYIERALQAEAPQWFSEGHKH